MGSRSDHGGWWWTHPMTVEDCFLACTAYTSHVCVSNQSAEVWTVCVGVGGETLSLMFLGFFLLFCFFGWFYKSASPEGVLWGWGKRSDTEMWSVRIVRGRGEVRRSIFSGPQCAAPQLSGTSSNDWIALTQLSCCLSHSPSLYSFIDYIHPHF